MLLVGETGTSKTATVSHFLQDLDKDTHLLLNINFSSRTTSLDVQRNLKANVEKRTKEVYGPPSGKRLILFLDDMNMPQARLRLVFQYVSSLVEPRWIERGYAPPHIWKIWVS